MAYLPGWMRYSAMVYSVQFGGEAISLGLPGTSLNLSRSQSSSWKATLSMYMIGAFPGPTSVLTVPVDRWKESPKGKGWHVSSLRRDPRC
jgi:hypothetical protein